MSDKPSPWDKLEQNSESKLSSPNTDSTNNAYDPLKLLNEGGKLLKDIGSKSAEAIGKGGELFFPSPYEKGAEPDAQKDGAKPSLEGTAKPGEAKNNELKAKPGNESAAKPGENKPGEVKTEAQKTGAQKSEANQKDSPKLKPKEGSTETPKESQKANEQQKPAKDIVPSKEHKDIAEKVIDRIKDSKDPVNDLKNALSKLDNLKNATVTRNGQTSHVEVHLKNGQTSAPPNISERGFTPVASHTAADLSFDLTHVNGGVNLTNMRGFSGSVQGPLGRIRHSETTGIFIGKDSNGVPFVNSSSDLYMRRRVYSNNTTLREGHFPADSPMRNLMHQPDALDSVSSSLRMFQSKDDLKNLSIKNNNGNLDVKSESKADKHVELNFKPKDSLIPITVKSMDLDKNMSASLVQGKDAVSLGKISGLTVNVEIGVLKMSLNPTKVSLEKDVVKMELTNPKDGSVMPFSIPVAKLKEAAEKKK